MVVLVVGGVGRWRRGRRRGPVEVLVEVEAGNGRGSRLCHNFIVGLLEVGWGPRILFALLVVVQFSAHRYPSDRRWWMAMK